MGNKKRIFSILTIFVLIFTIFSINKSFAACPGDGPAKPVSSVEILDPILEDDGNVIVPVFVVGYGRDFVKLDGNQIRYSEKRPIAFTCTGADAFLYIYNCGKLNTQWGYTVEAKFISDNFPYNTVSTSKAISLKK